MAASGNLSTFRWGIAYSLAVGHFDGDKAPDLGVGVDWLGTDSGVTVLLNNEGRESATVWNLNARHALVTLP
jgi:hypothetical protein